MEELNKVLPLGYSKSEYDKRDYCLAQYQLDDIELPKEYIIPNLPKVGNQGATGMCVAFTLAKMKEYQEFIERGKYQLYSPAYIFMLGHISGGEGMIPRKALQVLKGGGTPNLELFNHLGDYDYIKSEFDKLNSDEQVSIYTQAKEQVIKSYVRLYTIDEIKRVLLENRPVPIGVMVTEKFYHLENNIAHNGGVKKYGGHMILLVGWDNNGFIFQNSWGEEWGIDGRATLAYDYPIMESWGVMDSIPEKTKEEVKIFTDIEKNSWIEEEVEKAVQRGLVNGYPDGSFKPNNTITRAESVALANNVYEALLEIINSK